MGRKQGLPQNSEAATTNFATLVALIAFFLYFTFHNINHNKQTFLKSSFHNLIGEVC